MIGPLLLLLPRPLLCSLPKGGGSSCSLLGFQIPPKKLILTKFGMTHVIALVCELTYAPMML